MEVLGRERVDDLISQRADQTAKEDIRYKRDLLSYYYDELGYKMKTAATETAANTFKEQRERADLARKVFENGYKIAEKYGGKAAETYFMQMNEFDNTLFKDLMKNGFAEKLRGLEPSGEERLNKAAAGVLERELFPSSGTQPANPPAAGAPLETPAEDNMGESVPTVDNLNRTNAFDKNSLITSIKAGPITIERPQARATISRAEAIGALQGKKAEGETLPASTIEKFNDVTSSASELGNTLSSAVNNPNFRTYMGMFGAPKRFPAAFSKEGQLFRGFMASSQRLGNVYRKMITGAQASVQELTSYIHSVLGQPEKDTYETFLVKNLVASYATLGNLNQAIKNYSGYDTSAIQEAATELTSTIEMLNRQVEESSVDVSSLIEGFKVDERGKKIAKLMLLAASEGTPVDYEEAKKAIIRKAK